MLYLHCVKILTMQLESINIGEYLHLDPDKKEAYDFAVKYSKQCEPKDILNFGDIADKKFGEVKNFQTMVSSKDFFVKFLTYFDTKVIYLNVFDFFAFYNYFIKEVDRINLAESSLAHKPTHEEEIAGIERFEKFGVGIQVDNLAMGQVWMYDTINNLPYKDCFFKLSYDKTSNDYQRDYQNILMRKNG